MGNVATKKRPAWVMEFRPQGGDDIDVTMEVQATCGSMARELRRRGMGGLATDVEWLMGCAKQEAERKMRLVR